MYLIVTFIVTVILALYKTFSFEFGFGFEYAAVVKWWNLAFLTPPILPGGLAAAISARIRRQPASKISILFSILFGRRRPKPVGQPHQPHNNSF